VDVKGSYNANKEPLFLRVLVSSSRRSRSVLEWQETGVLENDGCPHLVRSLENFDASTV